MCVRLFMLPQLFIHSGNKKKKDDILNGDSFSFVKM